MSSLPQARAHVSSANRLRIAYRLPWILGIFAWGSVEALLLARRNPQPLDGALWVQTMACRLLRAFGISHTTSGTPPTHGLIAANHITYVDILVMSASVPSLFVSKSEVRKWPWLGWLTAQGGTIYIDRNRSARTQNVSESVEEGLRKGVPVAFYPEGTTTDGSHLLRFRAALFASAVRLREQVVPVAIRYSVPTGTVAQDVAFWGDMLMFPHAMRLLSLPHVDVHLTFGEPFVSEQKERPEDAARAAAAEAQARVAAMLGFSEETAA